MAFATPISTFLLLPQPNLISTLRHPQRPLHPPSRVASKPTISRAKLDGVWDDRGIGGVRGFGADYDDGDDEEEEEEEEGGLDAVMGLLQIFFRKVSRKGKKAARSVLPLMVPTKLVGFAVDGFLLLALLSVARALLDVVCNLGGIVFLVILLARTISAAALHYGSGSSDYENNNNNTRPQTA